VRHSRQACHHHAQGHPACSQNSRREGLNVWFPSLTENNYQLLERIWSWTTLIAATSLVFSGCVHGYMCLYVRMLLLLCRVIGSLRVLVCVL
jgi:hypothetical protein